MFDNLGRIAGNDTIGRYIFYNNTPCANGYIVSNHNIPYYNGTSTYLHVVSYNREVAAMRLVRANGYIMPNLAVISD